MSKQQHQSNKQNHSNSGTNNSINNNNNQHSNINNNNGQSNNTSGNSNNNNNHVRYPQTNTVSSTVSSKALNSQQSHHQQQHNSHLTSPSTTTSIDLLTSGSHSSIKNAYDTVRKSPEGKDTDSFMIDEKLSMATRSMDSLCNSVNFNGHHSLNSTGKNQPLQTSNASMVGHQKIGNDISTEIFSTSNDNGKINVQVTVLVGEFAFYLVIIISLFLFYQIEQSIWSSAFYFINLNAYYFIFSFCHLYSNIFLMIFCFSIVFFHFILHYLM